ncbi:unnamed protein product [Heterobilharzia americana]|nr:unnamed protein product [Heterobilharzia americana]
MSDLGRLIGEIGVEVKELTNQLELEKNNISGLQQKLLSLTREAESQKQAKQQLEEELKGLESLYFEPDVQCSSSDVSEGIREQIKCLDSVLNEIKSCNERIRKERTDLILEYKQKLDDYNRHIAQSEKLHAFIELWKVKCADNFRLNVIPDVIKETAKEISSCYESPLQQILENALNVPTLETEEREDADSKISPVLEENCAPNIQNDRQLLDPMFYNRLNSPNDRNSQLQDCSNLDTSRLQISALDTNIMSSLNKKSKFCNAKCDSYLSVKCP